MPAVVEELAFKAGHYPEKVALGLLVTGADVGEPPGKSEVGNAVEIRIGRRVDDRLRNQRIDDQLTIHDRSDRDASGRRVNVGVSKRERLLLADRMSLHVGRFG